jgi:hypothetical protein
MQKFGFDDNIKKFLDQLDNHRDILQAFFDGDMTKLSNLILTTYASLKSVLPELEENFNPDALIFNSLYTKLAKQFDQLPEPIKQATKKALLSRYNILVQMEINQIKRIKSKVYCQTNNSQCVLELETQLKTFIRYSAALILDSYAIGRILKTLYVYDDAKIIIVYAGELHIRNYLEILKSILAVDKKRIYAPIAKFTKTENRIGCFDLLPEESWKKVTDIVTRIFKSPSPCNVHGPGLGGVVTSKIQPLHR